MLCKSLYEINTRVWIRRFKTRALDAVPPSFFQDLATCGIDMLWAMGVWEGTPETIRSCCFEDALVQSYRKALPDHSVQDVIGSPYSINSYRASPALGGMEALKSFRRAANRAGMMLILDFVPNHFSAASALISSKPGLFLPGTQELLQRAPRTFYRPKRAPHLILAHGKDPYFDAWSDTAQVNYFSPEAAAFMTDQLLALSELCDGVRCDMAMLALNEVFERTWGEALAAHGFVRPAGEFWERSISAVKKVRPDFMFIAEAYWNLEGKLQQLGFDYTYDKGLYDRLCCGTAADLTEHLQADPEYQRRLVRFIENHDEKRAVAAMGRQRSMAAAVIASTLPGLRLFHDGQFEGRRVRLPVQLGREPAENQDQEIAAFYSRLLAVTRDPVFRQGNWRLLQPEPCGDDTYRGFVAYRWSVESENRLVAVNLSERPGQCHLKLDWKGLPDKVEFADLLSGESYTHCMRDLVEHGLYVKLPSFGAHIFRY